MLKRLSTLFLLLFAATPLFAWEANADSSGERHTIVVRDGNVFVDDDNLIGTKRAFIGAALTEITPELREFFGAPKDAGVLVSSLTENGPASKAGVRVGDVITAVNGKPVATRSQVISALRDNHAGDSVRIDTIRNKARQTVVATVVEHDGMPRIFKLPLIQRGEGTLIPRDGWRAYVQSPDSDELRARIRELENRLQDLEKKLQK